MAGMLHTLLCVIVGCLINGIYTTDPCDAVLRLDHEDTRSPLYSTKKPMYCDVTIEEGWYRMDKDMPTSCVAQGRCGTTYPIWLNGTIPEVSEGVVDRSVCISSFVWGCCASYLNIQVKNCGNYRVYNLVQTNGCHQGYCFVDTKNSTTPPPSTTTTSPTTTVSATVSSTKPTVEGSTQKTTAHLPKTTIAETTATERPRTTTHKSSTSLSTKGTTLSPSTTSDNTPFTSKTTRFGGQSTTSTIPDIITDRTRQNDDTVKYTIIVAVLSALSTMGLLVIIGVAVRHCRKKRCGKMVFSHNFKDKNVDQYKDSKYMTA